jgi:SAM-dependent methyltransferase
MGKETIYHKRWYAKEYDDDRFGGAFGHRLEDYEVGTFLSMIDGYRGRLLDAGAGTGKLSLPLIRQRQLVVSSDASMEMLNIARKKAETEGLSLQPVICDAHDLCFRDQAFGYVISSRLLMHLSDWRQGISELCRVAKVVVVDFPPLQGFSGLDSFLKRFIDRFSDGIQKYRAISVGSIVKEFERNNFRVTALKKHFFLPIAFHRRLNRPKLSWGIENFFKKLGLVSLLGAPVTIRAIKNDSPDIDPN